MKELSTEYYNKEYATQRQPVEIFDIWRGTTYWRYTSGDTEVTYDSHTYTPATILRGNLQYDTELAVSQLSIQFSRVTNPLTEFIAQNPVDILWIKVMRLFRDMDPYEAGVVFVGQVASVTIEGVGIRLRCVGFEQYLKQSIPIYRYQAQCNWTLFDLDDESNPRCGLNKANYEYAATINVSSNGLVVTKTSGDAWPDPPYFTLGHIAKGTTKRRMIALQNSTDTVTLRYDLGLTNGQQVYLYPGCDGSITTCKNKFNNVANFGGHPYIPRDNPITW